VSYLLAEDLVWAWCPTGERSEIIGAAGLLHAGYPTCHPANSVKVLNGSWNSRELTQLGKSRTDLILSVSTN